MNDFAAFSIIFSRLFESLCPNKEQYRFSKYTYYVGNMFSS